jgi:hypothetical protein
MWKKPLFEIRPDLFPEGYLTRTEIDLWNLYFKEKQRTSGN